VCPECLRTLPAIVFEKGGKVWMEKTCPEHGTFDDVVYADAEAYRRVETFRFGDGRGVENPAVPDSTACPDSCGLCGAHASHTALANIDLTNRCNLSCPVCFANANKAGYLYEPDLGQIRGMLERFRASRPVPCGCVQFAGGEPTLHPDFFSAVAAAKDLGFSAIQVASNGIRFAEPGFAERCAEAGLNSLYLQFDALDDAVIRKVRGKPLMEVKQKAIDAVRATKAMNVILVPTILKGVNDGEIGAITRFAVENVDVITGVSFQPVAITGRISREKRREIRFTLTDLAREIERQTGFARADAWAPLSALVPLSRLASAVLGREVTAYTAHHHCSMATYVFVDEKGRPRQIDDLLDLAAILHEMNALAAKLEASRFKFLTRSLSKIKALGVLEKHFNPAGAPEGLTFKRFLQAVEELMGSKRERKPGQPYAYRTLMIGAMHFMDSYNFDTERAQRCVVHYGAPDGRIYPFCAYNAGPTYRRRIEKKFAHSPESVRRIAEKEGYPAELKRLLEADCHAPGCVRTTAPKSP
jgi:uncharacterized radical SAM superfamily Fe-S cluster-containing enzyme